MTVINAGKKNLEIYFAVLFFTDMMQEQALDFSLCPQNTAVRMYCFNGKLASKYDGCNQYKSTPILPDLTICSAPYKINAYFLKKEKQKKKKKRERKRAKKKILH